MTETELSRQIEALVGDPTEHIRQKQKRKLRKARSQRKADRLLFLVQLPNYFPYRGFLTWEPELEPGCRSLLHTGAYIRYPKNSNRQKCLKRRAAKKARKSQLSGKGNHYRKTFDYKWELD